MDLEMYAGCVPGEQHSFSECRKFSPSFLILHPKQMIFCRPRWAKASEESSGVIGRNDCMMGGCRVAWCPPYRIPSSRAAVTFRKLLIPAAHASRFSATLGCFGPSRPAFFFFFFLQMCARCEEAGAGGGLHGKGGTIALLVVPSIDRCRAKALMFLSFLSLWRSIPAQVQA